MSIGSLIFGLLFYRQRERVAQLCDQGLDAV
jgi:hypothetical protein